MSEVYLMYGVPRVISISLGIHRAENPIIPFYSLPGRNIFRGNKIFVFHFITEERSFLCAKIEFDIKGETAAQ
jgi:hypothetical protein